MTGMAAQGPLPAGMLRIRQGSQERYVWPVHLPGWLGLGWQVAGAETAAGTSPVGGAAAEPPAPIAAAAGELLEQDDAKPASTRGRRGRRRKEEQERPPVGVEPQPAQTGSESEQQAEPDPEPLAAPVAGMQSGAEPGDVPTSDGDVSLTALPDDLFDDALI